MINRKYSKPRLNLDQQINFLKQQNLRIEDTESARHVLSVVGYYRFSGYSLPFKEPHNQDNHRGFKPGVTFDYIWQLYQFDRELRLLVADAIEKIEVAFRAAIAEITSGEFGIFWYTAREYYKESKPFKGLIRDVEKILKNKQEVFIQHYLDEYTEPKFPPIWMIIETLSFGACSKMFTNIKQVAVRKKISEVFQQHPTILESWVKTITWIRNLCAHHARLWNRWLIDAPIIPKKEKLHDYLFEHNRRFIVAAYILAKILENIAPKSPWKQKLYTLFEKYNAYPGAAMGFQENWQNDPFWDL